MAVNDRSTLSVGAPARIVDGQVISSIPIGIGKNSQIILFSAAHRSPTQAAAFVAGGGTYTAVDPGGDTAIMDGTNILAGGLAQPINADLVSAIFDGIIRDGHTNIYPSLRGQAPQVMTSTLCDPICTAFEGAGSNTTPLDSTSLMIGGPPKTINGVLVSAVWGENVENEQTIIYSSHQGSITEAAIFVVGGRRQQYGSH